MKRRNFFSKIVKGLLGIGIVTALPTPEVETVLSDTPQNLAETNGILDWTVPEQTPMAFAVVENQFYIVETGTWVAYDLDGNRQRNLPEGSLKRVCRRIRVNPKPSVFHSLDRIPNRVVPLHFVSPSVPPSEPFTVFVKI